jgi:ABC-type glutathione transport system ATPase component
MRSIRVRRSGIKSGIKYGQKLSMSDVLLEIKNLDVAFGRGASAVKAVRNVSLTIDKGETVALVGESGSGKSVTA